MQMKCESDFQSHLSCVGASTRILFGTCLFLKKISDIILHRGSIACCHKSGSESRGFSWLSMSICNTCESTRPNGSCIADEAVSNCASIHSAATSNLLRSMRSAWSLPRASKALRTACGPQLFPTCSSHSLKRTDPCTLMAQSTGLPLSLSSDSEVKLPRSMTRVAFVAIRRVEFQSALRSWRTTSPMTFLSKPHFL